jgi:hypothetical protein
MIANHIGVEAVNQIESAKAFASLLDRPMRLAGPDGDIALVPINDSFTLYFFQSDKPNHIHMAFHLEQEEFDALIERLKKAEIPFGTEPENPTNRRTDGHPFGGDGIYFADQDKNLWEFVTKTRNEWRDKGSR